MRIPSEIIPIKERASFLSLAYGRLDVEDGAFVLVDEKGVRIQIPVGGITCLLLEPGIVVTHAAISLASACGTLLLWVGEAGVRLYSSGQPGGARADRLLYQAQLALNDDSRLKVVRAMYQYRFHEAPAQKRSIEQLRGIEGARVKFLYQQFGRQFGVTWKGRSYDTANWDATDPLNRALSVACHCLYGVCEAAVLAAGYAPAIGFIHTGKPLSFVYDIADLVKFQTVIPLAFALAAKRPADLTREVRIKCRDFFRKERMLEKLIPLIDEILASGGLDIPKAPPEAVEPAIPNEKTLGDAGYRKME